MSVLGYFGRRRGELKMPAKADVLGIRYSGPVLTGAMSVELAQEREARRIVLKGKVGEPEEVDPVVRAHCRFDREG